MWQHLLALALLAPAARGLPAGGATDVLLADVSQTVDWVEMESAETNWVPSGWTELGRTAGERPLELTVAVRQRNLPALHELLMSVSDPASPLYGRHATREEVHALVAPDPRHVAAVAAMLRRHGAAVVMATSDMITATLPVSAAEEMLNATYFDWYHHSTNTTVPRAVLSGYRLPAGVAEAVDFIAPTVHIPGVRRVHTEHLRAAAGDDGDNTPKSLRKLYSIPESTVGKATANKQAVTAFLGQFYSKRDLKEFWSTYCSSITCGKGLPRLVGDATEGEAGIESMLDIETVTGVAGNISSEFWGFAGHSPDNPANEPFAKWLTQVSSTSDEDLPALFSTSYGEDEASWSLPAAERLNAEFMKAGARGVSLLFAAGDEGANCKDGRFVPEGPGSSPYVTAVGGTTGRPEKAVGLSSGGFSGYWPQPAWQASAVQGYLSSASRLPPTSRGYNISGRAYPDIAAQATDFCVTPFGCGVAGTSCASPTAAGVFSLLNDLRLQQGKSSLGFLNPLIYKSAEAFNDITKGESDGCDFGSGWPAAKGWDAVTGVGTPNYEKLAEVVLSLP